jgi:hypothetical protein
MPAITEQRREERQDANSLELSSLIRGLQSLVDGPSYINRLVAYGPKAIPPLADLLLNGKPSGISQPRQWTVEALAGLGAWQVLLSFLSRPLSIQSPTVQHGEEAVQNTAARELAAYQCEEAFTVLMDFVRMHPLPGVVETLGLYRRTESAPYFVDCLEDDVCRSAAVESLRHLGDDIRSLLIESALTRKPQLPDPENPSSIRRRRCCVRLLEPLHLTKEEVNRLRPLFNENDPDLFVVVAQVLSHSPHFDDYRAILNHLYRVRRTLGWWLQDEFKALISQIEENY